MIFMLFLVIQAYFAHADRDEAVKTAIQMESATKTLVDNLISELAELRREGAAELAQLRRDNAEKLAELRRENAEITMRAELLANEVRRLARAEANAPVVSEMPVQQHTGETEASLEEGGSEIKRGCPTRNKIGSCRSVKLYSGAQQQMHQNYHTTVCKVVGTWTCPEKRFSGVCHSATSLLAEASCCAKNKKNEEAYNEDVYGNTDSPQLDQKKTVYGFKNQMDGCASSKDEAAGNQASWNCGQPWKETGTGCR